MIKTLRPLPKLFLDLRRNVSRIQFLPSTLVHIAFLVLGSHFEHPNAIMHFSTEFPFGALWSSYTHSTGIYESPTLCHVLRLQQYVRTAIVLTL